VGGEARGAAPDLAATASVSKLRLSEIYFLGGIVSHAAPQQAQTGYIGIDGLTGSSGQSAT